MSADLRLLGQVREGRAGIGQEAISGLVAGRFRQVDEVLDQTAICPSTNSFRASGSEMFIVCMLAFHFVSCIHHGKDWQ
jgi:hypothetical protein